MSYSESYQCDVCGDQKGEDQELAPKKEIHVQLTSRRGRPPLPAEGHGRLRQDTTVPQALRRQLPAPRTAATAPSNGAPESASR